MSLKNNLYEIIEQNRSTYRLRFHADHPVFAGHFPEHPIVPGACLVQMAEELLCDKLNQTVHFTSVKNLKFREPVTPDMEVTLYIQASAENTFNFELSTTDSTNAQFKATYLCADTNLQ